MLEATTAPPLSALEADRIVTHADEGHLHLDDAEAYPRVVNEARRLQLRSEVWGAAPQSTQRRHYCRVLVVAAACRVVALALVIQLLIPVNS